MPVTPQSYTVNSEASTQTVNIHDLGDIVIAGKRKATNWTDRFLLPTRRYSFVNAGAYTDPQVYIDQLETWKDTGALIYYIVSGTNINIPVYITKLSYGEEDGTNNVQLTVTVARALGKTASTGAKKDVSTEIKLTYNRETMSFGSLCAKYYGEATLKDKLLKYNGYSSEAGVKEGAEVQIPPRAKL